jgi:hypothetical protein
MSALARKSRLNSASICDPRTDPQINIWSGSRTSPPGPHIGTGHWAEVDENGRIIDSNNIDVVVMGREYARQLEMSGTRPML